MSLKKYDEKRDFSRTPEPGGKTNIKKGEVLHFVVHKHKASHLHYDLRLELNGVLKSWAVPKGPSLNPNDKRLAMMVEDHPFDYKDFEGIIPKNNYGAGEVIIWDQGGYCSTETADVKDSVKLLNAGLAKGHIAILLQGEKLKGIFDLVKIGNTKKNSPENTWMLIKRKDEFASENDITQNDRSVVSGKTIEDLQNEENKDLSFQELIRDAPQAEMPREIEPMFANSVDEPFDRPGWLYEIKWDGYRAIAHTGKDGIKIYSRNHKSFYDLYPEIVSELKKIDSDAILDGEVVVFNERGMPEFQLLQNYPEEKIGTIGYMVFDIVFLNGKDLKQLPLIKRKNILKKLLSENDRIIYSDYVEYKGIDFYETATAAGLEGIVGKDGKSKYKEGLRSNEWLKIKKRMQQEAVIVGYTEPRGGRGYIGALILVVYKGGKLIYIGHTGGGFTDKGLKDMLERLHPLETEKNPFEEPLIGNAPVHWVKPELVCGVMFSNWTQEGVMRQPIFTGLREDKDPKEVTIEEKKSTEKIFKTEIKEKTSLKIRGREVIVTNGSKIYWPEDNLTKMDLVNYYLSIADYILPHLKNRPESMLRHPNGIYGESFFHKNLEEAPDWIRRFPFQSDTEERIINYLVCDDLPSLIYMVNLGSIEINPWNSTTDAPEFPDYMVIDLDPEEIDFKFVVEAALESKSLLDSLNIPSFCKTSGKTGLHIYVPTEKKYSYDQIRNFCEVLMRMVHRKLPNSTSIVRNPSERKKKVYLDYLQNRRGQTMSSPYSVRPIKGALVSTPLFWEEVNYDLDPSSFKIKDILPRFQKIGDIWKPVLGKGIDLEQIVQNLKV